MTQPVRVITDAAAAADRGYTGVGQGRNKCGVLLCQIILHILPYVIEDSALSNHILKPCSLQ